MAVIHGTRSKTDVLPSLDLRFSYRKDLIDSISGKNLINFSRVQSGTSKSTYFGADGLLKYADSNEPRFDHDPVTGESLGLLVEEARTNNQPYSSKYDKSHWGFSYGIKQTPNATVAPDGTLTATLIQQDTSDSIHQLAGGYGFNSGYITINSTYTLSLYVKYYNSNKIRLMEQNTYGSSTNGSYTKAGIIFNFATESIEKTIQWGDVSQSRIAGYSVDKLPNGWYRLKLSVIPGTDLNNQRVYFGIYPQEGNLSAPSSIPSGAVGIVGQNYSSLTNVTNFVGDGSTGVYIWGAQVEAGTFPTSYIPTPATFISRADSTQGASYYDANGIIQYTELGAPRDNAYFPDENGIMHPAGLLLEGTGTNYQLYSQDLTITNANISYGSLNGSTVLLDQSISPDGTNTADLVRENTGSSTHGLTINHINLKPGEVSGQERTLSLFAKSKELSKINIVGNFYGGTTFDLNSGTVVSSTGKYGIQKLANGWFRCWQVIPNNYQQYQIRILENNNLEYQGDGASGLYIWGVQLEVGSYPSSYIPTTTATVTRAADVSTSATVTRTADVAQITGTNFSSWYNPSEGTFYGKGRQTYTTPNQFEALITVGNFPNRSWIWAVISSINKWNAGTDGLEAGSFYTNLSPKTSFSFNIAQAQKSNDSVIAADGAIKATASPSQPLYTNSTILYMGSNYNGTISRLTYYPQRLQDTTLQKLTE